MAGSKNIILRKLKESYSLEMALIPILEQQVKAGKDHFQVHRCIRQLLRETRKKADNTKNYIRLLAVKKKRAASLS